MALAVEINVLSGAAVEPGLVAAADLFRKRTGQNTSRSRLPLPRKSAVWFAPAQRLMS